MHLHILLGLLIVTVTALPNRGRQGRFRQSENDATNDMNDEGGCPGKDDVIYLGEFTDDGEPVDETAKNNTRALNGNRKPERDGEPDEGRTYPRYPYGGMYIDGVFQPVPDDFGSYGGRRNGNRRRARYDGDEDVYPRYRRTY